MSLYISSYIALSLSCKLSKRKREDTFDGHSSSARDNSTGKDDAQRALIIKWSVPANIEH